MTKKILPGAYIASEVILSDNICVGANAVILAFTDPAQPKTIIEEGVEIGANATIREGVTLGLRSRIMPATVVTRSVPPLAIVQGNPAKIIGYINTTELFSKQKVAQQEKNIGQKGKVYESKVKNTCLYTLKGVSDLRGSLSVGEFERDIPFIPKRYFLVFDVPTAETRGEHAHYECHQFLIAIKGSINVVADDGLNREEYLLNAPNLGLHLPPKTWGIQYNYSLDAVLLVFASHYYEASDYIRNYNEFIEYKKNS